MGEYMALYRKARPKTFDDVRGQDQVVRALKNQVLSGRTQHAYLFCGTRGTGKTSVAKILARAVNCEHPVDGNPCGECPSCRSILDGSAMNVIEIDAASNNGVDNIRDIVEEVRYRPAEGRYKVYIIDEVHMLSTGAFNALLKTLEEPPEYVIFILATTEAGKIPTTILSRCQRYDFKRIDVDTIVNQMRMLAEKEGVSCEEKALRFVARQADGSMRDALSLLDQCFAFFSGEELTYEKALSALGAVDTDVYGEILGYVIDGNAGRAMKLFSEMMERGREVGQFVNDFVWYLRNLLLVSSADDASELVDMSNEQMDVLSKLSARISPEIVMRYIRVLSELQNSMRFASNRRVLTEVALVKLCRPQMEHTDDAAYDRIRLLEEQILQLRNGISAIQNNASAASDMSATLSTQTCPEAQPPTGHKGSPMKNPLKCLKCTGIEEYLMARSIILYNKERREAVVDIPWYPEKGYLAGVAAKNLGCGIQLYDLSEGLYHP